MTLRTMIKSNMVAVMSASFAKTCSRSAGRRADIGGAIRIDGGAAANDSKSAGIRRAGSMSDGGDDVEGGKKHQSSCGICLFLASNAARLLALVASLKVFAHFCGGGASCADRASSGGAGCGEASCSDWASSGWAGCGDISSSCRANCGDEVG
jgi:hypothetical protein